MVLDTIGAAGVIFKAKYVKRTGTSGNYKYWYRNPKTGKLQAGKQPAKKQGMSESTMRNIQQGGSVGGFIQRQKVDKLKKRLSSEQPAKKPSGSQGDDKAKKEAYDRSHKKLEADYFKKDREILHQFRKERDAEFDAIRKIKEKHRGKRDKLQKEQDSLFSKYESDSKKLRKTLPTGVRYTTYTSGKKD